MNEINIILSLTTFLAIIGWGLATGFYIKYKRLQIIDGGKRK